MMTKKPAQKSGCDNLMMSVAMKTRMDWINLGEKKKKAKLCSTAHHFSMDLAEQAEQK